MYTIYLDGVQLPVTPAALSMSIKNQNKTIQLINDGEVNTLTAAGLTAFKFSMMLPQTQYPFAVYPDGFRRAEYYLEKLEQLKISEKPFQFIVSRVSPAGKLLFDTNMKVSLEDYSMNEDAKDGLDISVSVNLKQYRDYGTKIVEIVKPAEEESAGEATVEEQRPAETAPTAKTYTVVKGDSLYNIAKKMLGKGSRWAEIYNLNKDKIKNPNLIYPGQVFTLPAA